MWCNQSRTQSKKAFAHLLLNPRQDLSLNIKRLSFHASNQRTQPPHVQTPCPLFRVTERKRSSPKSPVIVILRPAAFSGPKNLLNGGRSFAHPPPADSLRMTSASFWGSLFFSFSLTELTGVTARRSQPHAHPGHCRQTILIDRDRK